MKHLCKGNVLGFTNGINPFKSCMVNEVEESVHRYFAIISQMTVDQSTKKLNLIVLEI